MSGSGGNVTYKDADTGEPCDLRWEYRGITDSLSLTFSHPEGSMHGHKVEAGSRTEIYSQYEAWALVEAMKQFERAER